MNPVHLKGEKKLEDIIFIDDETISLEEFEEGDLYNESENNRVSTENS